MEEEAYESPDTTPTYRQEPIKLTLNKEQLKYVNRNNNNNIRGKNIDHECNICHGNIKFDEEDRRSIEKEISWICCENCGKWYHQICINMEEFQSILLDIYHCSNCEVESGPSVPKKIKCPHRYNFDKEEELDLPTQIGTKQWIDRFIEKESNIPAPSENVMRIYKDGNEFMNSFDWHGVWTNPVKILNKDGLGMRLPDPSFNIETIEAIVDTNEAIDTIDVYIQQSCKMKLKSFFEKWKETPRDRLYNMLSFEFSHTELMEMIQAPKLMYKLSWVHKIWHNDSVDEESEYTDVLLDDHVDLRPDVALFCLLGMGGSYTDFHIDFGGSSVWYHVFKGQKVFYIIPPTDENLEIFLKWTNDEKRTEIFLGDLVAPKDLYRVVIHESETVMIPSGWIHAVYTPVDSIVFGGNFIHELNVEMQLKVYSLELKAKYDTNFMFPHFELANWYAAKALTTKLRDANEDDRQLPEYIVPSLTALQGSLTEWKEKDKQMSVGMHEHFYYVIRELREELKNYRRLSNNAKKVVVYTETQLDLDDFIDDDEGEPIRKRKKLGRKPVKAKADEKIPKVEPKAEAGNTIEKVKKEKSIKPKKIQTPKQRLAKILKLK